MSSQGSLDAAAAQRNETVYGLKSPDTVVAIPPPLAAAELSKGKEKTPFDYSQRAQWLRTAILGTNDGLISVTFVMLGVGAVNPAAPEMVVSGLADLVAGACSMAMAELISVYSLRERERGADEGEVKLLNPLLAAGVSALAFAVGGTLPLLAGGFIGLHWVRMGVVLAVLSLELAGLRVAEAVLGGSPVARSTVRGVDGGWTAMIVTFGVLRIFSLAFKSSLVG